MLAEGVMRPEELRGSYLRPELYGQPEEMGEIWKLDHLERRQGPDGS